MPSFRGTPSPSGVLPGVLALLMTGGCTPFPQGPPGHWDELAHSGVRDGTPFSPALVEGLPEPARRFLLWSLEPGTLPFGALELAMEGTMRLAPDQEPMALEARQVLAPPRGFIWSARASRGLLRIHGYDRFTAGEGEMRWKLFGLVPVMTARGSDTTRSAAGRLLMEGVLVPAFLVPGWGLDGGVEWEPVDEDHAAFLAEAGGERVRTVVEVAPDGRPVRAWAQRWNEGAYERFEVRLSGEVTSGGVRLPAEVEAGWRPGEPEEFFFFRARITRVDVR